MSDVRTACEQVIRHSLIGESRGQIPIRFQWANSFTKTGALSICLTVLPGVGYGERRLRSYQTEVEPTEGYSMAIVEHDAEVAMLHHLVTEATRGPRSLREDFETPLSAP